MAELLHTADIFLLPGLKKICGRVLARLLDTDTVMDILKTARLFNLARLEDQATEFLARNIEVMMNDVELHKMIEEDAADVKDRQETDSVQIIDDIRSQIRSFSHFTWQAWFTQLSSVCRLSVRTMSDLADAEQRMTLVEHLLGHLGMEI